MSWTVYNSSGQLLQATDLPDDVVGVAELSATGTASSSTFLRGDNAWAAPAGGPSQAVQSAIEAETNEDTYLPPDLIKHSPGVAKVWCRWEQQGAHSIAASYNMDSVTDSGAAGGTDLLYDIDFSTVNYALAGNTHAQLVVGTSGSPTAAGVTIYCWDSSDEVYTDASRVFLICAGDQA